MANQIIGNVLIVDSGTINLQFPGDGNQALVKSIAFWGANTTGSFQLAYQSNSATVVINMASPIDVANLTYISFGDGQYFDKLRAVTVTAGTGYIYLK